MPPASASAVSNAAAAKAERMEKLRTALKAFILKDRQRKREEYEAKIEEERLRKEREARERQNDMTLEETRGQIAKLDKKIEDLQKQKSQLFLELKKVLNEDNNRKKEQKDNEMLAMQAMQAQQSNVPGGPSAHAYMPPVRLHNQMPILPKPLSNQPVKRGRSPSPPTHQGYYKSSSYNQPKHEDTRRPADYARVLWNKPPTQYQNPPGTLFYQTTPGNAAPPSKLPPDSRTLSIPYSAYNLPLRQSYHLELQPAPSVQVPVSKAAESQKPSTQIYHLDQTPISQANSNGPAVNVGSQKTPQVTMEKIERYHVDVKHDSGPPPPHGLPEGVVYTSLIPGIGALHPNVLQISSNAPPSQSNKPSVSISQSYGSRGQASAHEAQMVRQQQLSVMPGQPGPGQPPPPQQPLHYQRRLY